MKEQKDGKLCNFNRWNILMKGWITVDGVGKSQGFL